MMLQPLLQNNFSFSNSQNHVCILPVGEDDVSSTLLFKCVVTDETCAIIEGV